MTDTDPAAARARGQALRESRLARARTIRRRIVGGAVALFVATWLLITIVLVSGHDPALAKRSSATTAASTTAASTPATTTGSTSSASSGTTTTSSSDNSSSSNSGSSGVSSVTTSQS